ncbi:hypothetical protein HN615_01190 [Candidatus Woesearchaeota archaeon]|jgi:methionyl-tRNA formyltransferase|nr:hypothetical protein [Candidatus Woesearchaeota archaeon]
MKFNKINRILLFGGSQCLVELSKYFIASDSCDLYVYTSDRQLKDIIYGNSATLKTALEYNNIDYCTCTDINNEESLKSLITDSTLGIGLGEDWIFTQDTIGLFDGRLLDLMGVRLPQYRGGAHYTWQILRGNKIGACNLQVVNSDTVQGVFDSGEIIKSKEYFFPASARTPSDYFEHAVIEEVSFIKSFIDEVNSGFDFKFTTLQEGFSQYYPRLNTIKNAFIDWSWSADNIDKFICAFDDPYAGASTFLDEERVFLKKCYSESNEGGFHPFQSGMIYKINNNAIFIATITGTIVVKEVLDLRGKNIMTSIRNGSRFYTPNKELERSQYFFH